MSRIDSKADAKFAAAMQGRSTTFSAKPAHLTAVPDAPLTPPDPNAISLGVHELNAGPDISLNLIKLLDGRLLIQGASGAGKSWTLRRLMEQSAGRIQQIIVDPEGELVSLAEELGYLYIESRTLDGRALGELARRVRQHRLSIVLDLSDQTREEQMISVAAFFHSLIECPRETWHPTIVAIDEVHLFAPFGGQSTVTTPVRKAATGAIVDLMSRGRKRGLAGVLATQRLARLSKSVVSEVHNFLIGVNTLDLDVKRAAETIGWETRKAYDRLPMLQPGEFVACGPAFSLSPIGVKIGAIRSRHIGATPVLSVPDGVRPEDAKRLLDIESLEQESETGLEDRAIAPGFNAVRAFVRDGSFLITGQVMQELRKLMPLGANLDELAAHMKLGKTELAATLAHLEAYDIVEIENDAARVSPKFYSGA